MKGITCKEFATLAKRLRKVGWTVENTRGGHLRWTRPDGAYCITPSTPGHDGKRHSLRKLALMEAGRDFPGLVHPKPTT